MKPAICLLLFISLFCADLSAQGDSSFKVLSFFTAKNDLAHISFVKEANQWFADQAKEKHFSYDSTSNWSKLNKDTLARYQVILFLDTRPEDSAQRTAFETYMKNGGAWMGFHFAGFALTPSSYPQNWDWYHSEFLGSGEYKGNTWRPTAAVLRKENSTHPATRELPATFVCAPNEWYSWQNDLRKNPDIEILYSIDSSSFPLGTGPKPHEIWHSGFYPVVWTNKNYKMLYINMGHNDMDYETGSNKTLSWQFANPTQNKLLLNGLLWLGGRRRPGQ
ncbi:MAG: ThuA domain-containing protein [Chitinophagaceae bacterium]|nr:MAG: ThuA domain-containing protein [Chitinophagaceae bacterium]